MGTLEIRFRNGFGLPQIENKLSKRILIGAGE